MPDRLGEDSEVDVACESTAVRESGSMATAEKS